MRTVLKTLLAVLVVAAGGAGLFRAYSYLTRPTPLQTFYVYFPDSVEPKKLLAGRVTAVGGCSQLWVEQDLIVQLCTDHVLLRAAEDFTGESRPTAEPSPSPTPSRMN
jgi:hypothetical protein